MQSGLFLDVVVRECAAILELLASENETLLVRRNALLVLNLNSEYDWHTVCTFCFTLSIKSPGSTLRVMVLPEREASERGLLQEPSAQWRKKLPQHQY